MTHTPYVYKWTHLPTMRWYVGSRTAKKCHPDDGYICSSKDVKRMIKNKPWEWAREIIHVGIDAYEVETEILQIFDARRDARSFNKHNNDGLALNKSGIGNSFYGKRHTEEWKQNASATRRGEGNSFYGRQHTAESKEINRQKHLGKVASDEQKLTMSVASKKKWAENYDYLVATRARGHKRPDHAARMMGDNNPNAGPQERVQCPHCPVSGGKSVMKRWHFDKCPHKDSDQ